MNENGYTGGKEGDIVSDTKLVGVDESEGRAARIGRGVDGWVATFRGGGRA